MRLAALVVLATTTPALAQTYPFEGRWRSGQNSCEYGLVVTSAGLTDYALGGDCQFTKVGKSNATTFSYTSQCKSVDGDYASSGTFQMSGNDRMVMRDKRRDNQATTYDRCGGRG